MRIHEAVMTRSIAMKVALPLLGGDDDDEEEECFEFIATTSSQM
jgi:hypothetical protein